MSATRTFDVTAPRTDPPILDPPPVIQPPAIPPTAVPPSTDPPVVVPPRVADTTAPTLSRVSLSATRFTVGRAKTAQAAAGRKLPRGTTVRYTLSEPATVTIAITRSGSARAVATLTRRSAKGPSRIAYSGRIGSKPLPSGRYALTLRAVDAAGNRSAPKTVSFRIG